MEEQGTVRKRSALAPVLACMAALLALTLGLAGCSTETEPQSVSDGVITVEVPGSWTVEDYEEASESMEELGYSATTGQMAYPDDGYGLVFFYSVEEVLDGSYTADAWTYSIAYGFESSDEGFTLDYDSLEETTTSDDAVIDTLEFAYVDEDDAEWEGSFEIVYSGDTLSVLVCMCLTDEAEEYGEEVDDILDSLVVEDPSEPLLLDEEALEEELAEDLEEEVEEAEESTGTETLTDGQVGDGEYTITLAGDWYVSETVLDESSGLVMEIGYSSDFSKAVVFYPSFPTTGAGYSTMDEYEASFIESFEVEQSECTESTISDVVTVHRYDYADDDGAVGYIQFTYSGDTCGLVVVFGYDESDLSDLQAIVDSMTVANPTASTFA